MCRKKKYDLLAVVHGETSTGMLNHLEEVSQLCSKREMLFLVDAISSLGGTDLSVDKLGIDFCISASQKALGSIPGLSTISISAQDGKNGSGRKYSAGTLILKLKRYEKEWADWHPFPITLPVHLFYALNKAFDKILEEGLEQRWAGIKRLLICFAMPWRKKVYLYLLNIKRISYLP